MQAPFGKRLAIQADLDGWSVVIPGGRVSLFEAAILVPHLLMGGAFAGFGGRLALQGGDVTGGVGAIFALVGSIFAANAGWRFLRTARSTRLEVSHNDLQLERRLLGVRLSAPRRMPLAELGPVSFSGPSSRSVLHLSPSVRLPAFVDTEHRDLLVDTFETCIAQARAEPGQIPAPPRALQELLQRS